METPLWVVQRHWQKDPYHPPGSPVVHGTQGAQLPCRPHCPGGPDPQPCTEPPGGPAPLPSTTAGGPSSLRSTSLPSRRRSPTGLPVPLPGGFSCLGLCRSSCPFPALFPRLLFLRYFARLLPIPRWSHRLGTPSAHSLMGSNPGPPREGGHPGVSAHRRLSHDATLCWQ